jgi:undecaprenyl diphosphate synthase
MIYPAFVHVAIIMDGNGRWACQRGLPRLAGHRRGADAVLRAAEAAPDCGVSDLTLYAFSADNWRRPEEETDGLMELFGEFLARETRRCLDNDVRLMVVGRRDRLPRALRAAIALSERATASGTQLTLRIAVDYSSRWAIEQAIRVRPRSRPLDGQLTGLPDVDLLIRTGGEQRLSDFLLWECAYAELLFLPVLWPDFMGEHLADAVSEFQARNRRFGGLPAGYCGVAANPVEVVQQPG